MKPTTTNPTSTKISSLGIIGAKKLLLKEIYRLELALDKIVDKGASIVTGDEDGTDQIVIMYCNGKKYEKLTVIGSYSSCAYFSNFGENEIYTKPSSARDKDIIQRAKKFIIVGSDARQSRLQGFLEKSGKEFLRIHED